MSRMMGIVSRGPVSYEVFEEFADLATKGIGPLGAPDERGHRDGWGLACFLNGTLKFHVRDVGAAPDASKYYGYSWKISKLTMQRAEGQSLIVLGHLRRAVDRARIGVRWSQPLIEERDGETWAFLHDGSLLREPTDPERVDSEVLFRFLLDALEGSGHEGVAAATKIVRTRAIDEFGGFTGLSFLLSDGSDLHAYRDFQTNAPYYTLIQDDLGEMAVTASEPILGMKAEGIPRGVLCTVSPDLETQRVAIA